MELKRLVKTRWGKLTDDDLDVIAGHKDRQVGRIQERYGIRKEEAERHFNEWNTAMAEENESECERRKAS